MVIRSALVVLVALALAAPAAAQEPCRSAVSRGPDYGTTPAALDLAGTPAGWRLWVAKADTWPTDIIFDVGTPAETRTSLGAESYTLAGTEQRADAVGFRRFTLFACPPDVLPVGAGFRIGMPLVTT